MNDLDILYGAKIVPEYIINFEYHETCLEKFKNNICPRWLWNLMIFMLIAFIDLIIFVVFGTVCIASKMPDDISTLLALLLGSGLYLFSSEKWNDWSR